MDKSQLLTNNSIEKILKIENINKEENIGIYLKIIEFKIIDKQNNLYICKLKDNNSSYNRFILKSSKNLLKDNIIYVKKIRITISGKNKYISILNYENVEQEKIEDIKKNEEKINDDEKKINEEKSLFDIELNEETKLLLENVKHNKKKKKRYFFKWDKGNLKLIDNKNKKEEISEEKSLENNKIDDVEQNFDMNEILDSINELKEEEKDEDEDKKEIDEIFDGINVNELFKINEKRNNRNIDFEKEFQLIINLSTKSKGNPLYIKCINKQWVHKEKQKYLLFILRDPEGGEINAYVYNKDINVINNMINPNGIYIISDYLIKPKVSSTFLNCDYRLVLKSYTKIQAMPPDSIFNKINFHCLTIDDLFYFKEGTIIDICGIIFNEAKLDIIKTRNGSKMLRNIMIIDKSMKKVYITIWEPHCQDNRIKFEKGEILAVKYCKVFLYPEKIKKLQTMFISILQNSTSNYETDLSLKEFYENHKNINDYSFVLNPPEYLYLEQLKNEIRNNIKNKIDNYDKSFTTKGYIDEIVIDEKSIYNGCPFCHRKLKELEKNDENYSENMKYECFICKKKFVKPKYILKLSFRVRDANERVFFNMVGDEAQKFLDIEPDIVKKYLDEKNFLELKKIEKKVLFQEYILIGRLTTYHGQNGNIVNRAKVENFEKAEGENLKRILQLIEDED